ncbi:hypothetical protein D3C84_978800 [compost metagenome]
MITSGSGVNIVRARPPSIHSIWMPSSLRPRSALTEPSMPPPRQASSLRASLGRVTEPVSPTKLVPSLNRLRCMSFLGIPMVGLSYGAAGGRAGERDQALTRAAKSTRKRSVMRCCSIRFSSGGTGV